MAAPAIRYVDPENVSGTASDANNGTAINLAWLTLGKAIDSAPGGSLVYCRSYTIPTLTISGKGTSRRNKAKTVIAPYPGESIEMATPSNVTLTNCHKVTITGVRKTAGAVKGGGFTIEDCSDVGIVGCGRLDGSVEGLRGIGLTAGSNPANRNKRIQICANYLKQDADTGFLVNMSASGESHASTPHQRVMVKRNRMREGQVAVRAGFFNFCWVEDNDIADILQLDPDNHTDGIRTVTASGEFAGSNWYVRRNFTHDCDTIAFFIKDGIVYNLVYENNLTDQDPGFGDCSIYNVQGARIVNNTLAGAFTWSLQGANPAGVTMFNNIANNHNKDPDTTVGFAYKGYNTYAVASPGVTDDEGAETNSMPFFVDVANDDYDLAAGSPGLNSGRLAGAPTTDQRGRPRPFGATVDRGALERQTAAIEFAVVYHVSPSGSDAASGLTVGTAWQTLGKAIQAATDDSGVYIHEGTYSPGTSLLLAATRSSMATFLPYPGDTVTVATKLVLGRAGNTTDNGIVHVTFARFEDLDFEAGLSISWRCQDIEVAGCRFTEPAPADAFIGVSVQDLCERIVIEDNEIHNGRNIAFTNSGIHTSGTVAEPITNCIIRRNVIEAMTVGINLRGFDGMVVEDNEIYGIEYDGSNHTDCIRTFAGGTGLQVRRNFIHDCEGLGFFIKDGAVSDVDFTDNLIVRMVGGFAAFNVYDTTGIRVLNNTLDGSCVWQQTAAPSTGIVFANNICATHQASGTTPAFDYRDYNLIEGTNSFGAAINEITGPAVYVNEAGDDYDLVGAGAGVNAGTAGPVSGNAITTTDQLGRTRPFGAAPDMGARERQS